MSRNPSHDIDLSALPTVADSGEDDLIDRDEQWHEFQRRKLLGSEHHTAAVVEETIRQDPEVLAEIPASEPESVASEAGLGMQPLAQAGESCVEFARLAEEEAEAEPEIAIAPRKPMQERLIKKGKRKDDTPPVKFATSDHALVKEVPQVGDMQRHADMPKPPDEKPLSEEQKRHLWWQRWKEKIGTNSLGISIGIHVLNLLIGA